MKTILKAVFSVLVGLSVAIGVPLIASHLPPGHGTAFSRFASAAMGFMEISSIFVVAEVLATLVWRSVQRRRVAKHETK